MEYKYTNSLVYNDEFLFKLVDLCWFIQVINCSVSYNYLRYILTGYNNFEKNILISASEKDEGNMLSDSIWNS